MAKIISFMHVSLDGFVAGPKGEMDWIKVDEEIFDHVGERIKATDMALYGRVTYLMMENYWPNAGEKPNATKHDIEHSSWYNRIHKVVLSKTLKDPDISNTSILSDNITKNINEIKQQPGKEILLFGSPTATKALIELGLIDGYWLFINPVILGQGIPLFQDIKNKIKLNLLTSRKFACGVVELNYIVDNS